MAKKVWAVRLPNVRKAEPKVPVIGVFAACDPRIDEVSFHMGRVCRAYHLGWSKKSPILLDLAIRSIFRVSSKKYSQSFKRLR